MLPTTEAADLIDLVREIADRRLRPAAAEHEAAARFPRDAFRALATPACSASSTRRNMVAVASPPRSTCRYWRKSPQRG
jgi:hypothetical protein